MTEKLIIKNFAGIEELEIEVKKINILIGPETSGKSICAKLLFYFKDFFQEISLKIEGEQENEKFDLDYSQKFQKYFPPESWGENDFYIKYLVSDEFVEIRRDESVTTKALLNYSSFFVNLVQKSYTLLEDIEKQIIIPDGPYSDILRLQITRDTLKSILFVIINESLEQKIKFTQLFIPASRSIFATLQSNMFSVFSSKASLDPFLVSFGSSYENINKSFDSWKKMSDNTINSKNEVEIKRLIKDSLQAIHIREKEKDFLDSDDGRRVNIANSSSGQQELLPLTIILEALPHLVSHSLGYTVYVEEPEAHLFPNTQRNIIELMATVFNSCEDKLQLFITTHSPYILTAINNLLQSGQIYETADEDTRKKLEEIIPKYKSLKTADVAAYSLSDGGFVSIINPETGLIDAQIIDSVSQDLSIQFDELLDLI